MNKTKTETGMRSEFKETILRDGHDSKICILCRNKLDENEDKRGIIEFTDGWFWICSNCRKLVGKSFDLTQCKDYAEWEVIRYYGRSRSHWIKWFDINYKIKIPTLCKKEHLGKEKEIQP